jgi:hypothetical protein
VARVELKAGNAFGLNETSRLFKNKTNGKYLFFSGKYIYTGTGSTLTFADTVWGLGTHIVEHGAGYYIIGGNKLCYYDFNTLTTSATLPGTNAVNLVSNGQSVYTMTYKQIGNDYIYYLNKFKAGVLTLIDSHNTDDFDWGSVYDYSFPKENVTSLVMGLGPNSYYVDDNDAITAIPNEKDLIRDYGVVNGKHIFCNGNSQIKAFDKATKTVTQL